VDAVSGATFTSASYMQSVQSALDKLGFKAAGGSRATLQVPQGGGDGGPGLSDLDERYKPGPPVVGDSAMTSRWPRVLALGLAAWATACILYFLSDDEIFVPSVILLGSFVVPVTVVFWLLDHRTATELEPDRLLTAFLFAGVLGMVASGSLETWLLPGRVFPNLWVGLIEEAAKGIAVALMARGLPAYRARDGLVLGATVGFGFAAFETSGYALSAAITPAGISLKDLISIEVLRAVLAPLGHGLWTGLLGAALFRARLRLTAGVFGTYLAVVALHAFWDSSTTIASVVTVIVDGSPAERHALGPGNIPDASGLGSPLLFGTVQWAVTIAVSIAGVAIWLRNWRASAEPG
jgi:protease PrsW